MQLGSSFYTFIIVFLVISLVFMAFEHFLPLYLSWQTSAPGRNQPNYCLFLSIFHQIILENMFLHFSASPSPEIILAFYQAKQIARSLSHFALFLSSKQELLTFWRWHERIFSTLQESGAKYITTSRCQTNGNEIFWNIIKH